MSICETSRDLDPNQRWATTQSCSAVSSRNDRSPAATAAATSVIVAALDELEPVEAAGREREQVAPLADAREARAPEHLHGVAALPLGEVELDRLRGACEVVQAEHDVALVGAHVGEDAVVGGRQRLVLAEAEHGVLLAQGDEAPHPAQEAR